MVKRVVNLRYKCCGLHFDAAIDCDWSMHCYDLGLWGLEGVSIEGQTPIELFCMEHSEWDIKMIYYQEAGRSCVNAQQNTRTEYLNTLCDMEFIKKETRKWVREMNRKK